MNTLKNKQVNQKPEDKLPFAVFICPKPDHDKIPDYKQIFTDIISERIKEKYQ